MATIQSLIGYLFILISVVFAIATGEFFPVVYGVFAGLVLISLAHIVDSVQDLRDRSLGLPLTDRQIRKIRMKTKEVKIISETLKIHPSHASYPVLQLDQEYYIRVKAFVEYLSQDKREYTFHFPNHEPVVFTCAFDYRPGIKLFELDEQVYIQLSSISHIGMTVDFREDGLVIET